MRIGGIDTVSIEGFTVGQWLDEFVTDGDWLDLTEAPGTPPDQ